MVKLPTLGIALLFCSLTYAKVPDRDSAKALIEQAVKAHGGKEAFYRMRDVQFRLVTKDLKTNQTFESIEQYLFEGERSKGTPSDPLTRRTNYFRFAIPFKLLDAGLQYHLERPTKIGTEEYSTVEVSFEKGVGETQDRFRFFIHPKTHRIDAYLFTDEARGVKVPMLVQCTNEEISGVWICINRKYFQTLNSKSVEVEEQLDQIQFWNGFTPDDFNFQKPSLAP